MVIAIVAFAALLAVAAAGCGGGADDANEPNDELSAATTLTPGTAVDGVIASDDSDVFKCDAPGSTGSPGSEGAGSAGSEGSDAQGDASGDGSRDDASDDSQDDASSDAQDDTAHPFTVTVRSDSPDDLELEVGASVPDAWEGITWPGWEVARTDDRLEVQAALREGTVIMVLTGEPGTEYSISIDWE